jgi:hypothetical protein
VVSAVFASAAGLFLDQAGALAALARTKSATVRAWRQPPPEFRHMKKPFLNIRRPTSSSKPYTGYPLTFKTEILTHVHEKCKGMSLGAPAGTVQAK